MKSGRCFKEKWVKEPSRPLKFLLTWQAEKSQRAHLWGLGTSRYLLDPYDPFLGVLVGDHVEHVQPLALSNAVLKLCVDPNVHIAGFNSANGRTRWRRFWGFKLVSTYESSDRCQWNTGPVFPDHALKPNAFPNTSRRRWCQLRQIYVFLSILGRCPLFSPSQLRSWLLRTSLLSVTSLFAQEKHFSCAVNRLSSF